MVRSSPGAAQSPNVLKSRWTCMGMAIEAMRVVVGCAAYCRTAARAWLDSNPPGPASARAPRLGSCDAQAAASTKIECSSVRQPLKTTPSALTRTVAPPVPDLLPLSGPSSYRGSVPQLHPLASSLRAHRLGKLSSWFAALGWLFRSWDMGRSFHPPNVYRPRQPACTQLLLSISLYLYTILRHI